MKSFVVALALVAGAVAKPGGYTGDITALGLRLLVILFEFCEVTNTYIMLSCISSVVSGYGGVYKAMNVNADTMDAAKQASKMANLFDDESLQGDIAQRAERNSPMYVPTFFTGVPQTELHPVAAAHVESNRFQREANVSIYF